MWQAGSGRHQGRFLLLRRTAGFDGGEEAAAFPTEGQGQNPGEATATHLEKKSKLIIHRALHLKKVSNDKKDITIREQTNKVRQDAD